MLKWLCLLVCLAGCLKENQGPNSVPISGAWLPTAEFLEIEKLYKQKNYHEAREAYAEYLLLHPKDQGGAEAQYKIGKIDFIWRDYESAQNHFKALTQSRFKFYRAKGWHMSGFVKYRLGDCDSALVALAHVETAYLPDDLAQQSHSMVHRCAEGRPAYRDLHLQALFSLYNLHQQTQTLSQSILTRAETERALLRFMDAPLNGDGLHFAKVNGAAKPLAQYLLARFELESHPEKARKRLKKILEMYPQSLVETRIKHLLKPHKNDGEVLKLGVLLPLSGQAERENRLVQSSQRVLDGIRCAIGEGQVCGHETALAQLVVIDSGWSEASINQAMEALANTHRVHAILGPLSGELSYLAVKKASELRIPLLPITQKENLMQEGSFIFQVGLTSRDQVTALVRESMNRGHKNFAILAPLNSYGQIMSTQFSEEVISRGGFVSAILHADVTKIDSQKVKNFYQQGFSDLVHESKRATTVFIPDSLENVYRVANLWREADLPSTAIIGTNVLNDSRLDSTVFAYFSGSFFMDLFFENSPEKHVQYFREMFQKSFKHSPSVLEALAYDAAGYVHQSFLRRRGDSLQQVMDGYFGYEGVTGLRGFKAYDAMISDVKVMELHE